MRALLARHFPEQTCISNAQGGSVFWVRCQSHIKTQTIFTQAIKQGVSFAPGVIFSLSGKYQNYMRISFGVQWQDDIEQAVAKLGKLVYNYAEVE
jgi:DNA-binding transcriptional MocR family regulator